MDWKVGGTGEMESRELNFTNQQRVGWNGDKWVSRIQLSV